MRGTQMLLPCRSPGPGGSLQALLRQDLGASSSGQLPTLFLYRLVGLDLRCGSCRDGRNCFGVALVGRLMLGLGGEADSCRFLGLLFGRGKLLSRGCHRVLYTALLRLRRHLTIAATSRSSVAHERAEVAGPRRHPLAQPTLAAGSIFVREFEYSLLASLTRLVVLLLEQQLPRLPLSGVGPLEESPDLIGRKVMGLLVVLECCLREAHLEDLEAAHLVLHETAGHKSVSAHLLLLADAVGPVHRLRICGGIPSRINNHHAVGTGEVQTHATHTCCEQHALEPIQLLLELVNLLGAGHGVRHAIDAEALQSVGPQHTDLHEVEHPDAL
mmetsp:Transcript_38542/g.81896  ORF Transcript_38542/g.81896 Transcript_38542/m.81896 type:complete len:328 (+) Transcript_38542:1339-2322(+)